MSILQQKKGRKSDTSSYFTPFEPLILGCKSELGNGSTIIALFSILLFILFIAIIILILFSSNPLDLFRSHLNELSTCIVLWVFCWSYLVLVTRSFAQNNKENSYDGIVFCLFLFLLSSILFFIYHLDWWTYLNDKLIVGLKFIDNEKIDQLKKHSFNAIPLVTSFLSTGLLILSLSKDRHSSNLNPYTLQQYFPVLPFLFILLFILVSLIFFIVANLYALIVIALTVHISICVSVSVYFHVFHTPWHIAYQMSNVLNKKLKRCKLPGKSGGKYYAIWKKNASFKQLLDDMTLWKRQLLENAKKSIGDSLYTQVNYHAFAISRSIADIPSIVGGDIEAQSYLVFAMGLWIGTPIYGIDDRLAEDYIFYMLKAFNQIESQDTLLKKQFIRGMLAAQLFEAYRPMFPTIWDELQNDAKEKCTSGVSKCMANFKSALNVNLSPDNILRLTEDSYDFLKAWIVYMILTRVLNEEKEIRISKYKQYLLGSNSNNCFNPIDRICRFYLENNHIGIAKTKRCYSTAMNALNVEIEKKTGAINMESDQTLESPVGNLILY